MKNYNPANLIAFLGLSFSLVSCADDPASYLEKQCQREKAMAYDIMESRLTTGGRINARIAAAKHFKRGEEYMSAEADRMIRFAFREKPTSNVGQQSKMFANLSYDRCMKRRGQLTKRGERPA